MTELTPSGPRPEGAKPKCLICRTSATWHCPTNRGCWWYRCAKCDLLVDPWSMRFVIPPQQD